MLLRTLATHLRPGNTISLLSKNNGKKYLLSNANSSAVRNVRFLHQHYKEILGKRKPMRKAILVFLVGPARYAETAEKLREISYKFFVILLRQCEVHIGLKIRRSLHFYFFYSRIWGEEMAAKMFAGLRKSLMARTKLMLCSVLPMSVIDWQTHGVPDEKFDEALQEYVTVKELCSATIICEQCLKRKIIDKQIESIDYCNCLGQLNYTDSSCVFDSWTPFIERNNTIVWRKKHDKYKDMYCYKVYGQYDDISANSFAEVQLNTSNRLTWDPTALQLTIEGSDAASNNELLYWRVKFPTFFANRDYVYKRRFQVNENLKEIIIVGEAVQHDKHPKIPGIHRVEDYWACMVIRANNDFHVPGMSYTLTYFDNPGTTLPTAITNLIASKSFPDFLSNVHSEACRLQKKWDTGDDAYISLPPSLRNRRNSPGAELKSLTETISDSEPSISVSLDQERLIGAIKENLTEFLSSDPELNRDAVKSPASFRDDVVDLLEAIRVVPPEVKQDHSFRAQKVHEFVEKMLSEEHPSVLLQKLAQLTEKTLKLVEQCAAKKEDSFRIMREVEKRSHYNYRHYDDSMQQILTKFFTSFNDTLRKDKDLRTGRLLTKPLDPAKTRKKLRPPKTTSPTAPSVCPCCAKPFNKSEQIDLEHCPRCYCNMVVSSHADRRWSGVDSWTQLGGAEVAEETVNPSKPVQDPRSAWYFFPVFSTWKLLLWLLSPWSAGNT